jgi:hypothetical protein
MAALLRASPLAGSAGITGIGSLCRPSVSDVSGTTITVLAAGSRQRSGLEITTQGRRLLSPLSRWGCRSTTQPGVSGLG